MRASYKKYVLDFKRPSGTSRGIMSQKETWFISLIDDERFGIGECGLLRGLSVDDRPDYENKLKWVCDNIALGPKVLLSNLNEFPSIQFGVEQAFLSLDARSPFLLFPSEFTNEEKPIDINGLIWMGNEQFMLSQIEHKLADGFSCIKLKIGAIDFEKELKLLSSIRSRFNKDEIEIRVDANGAFKIEEALDKLKVLATFDIHSIEQPIKPNDWRAMAQLCKQTPLPIALDEELIGIYDQTKKKQLLQTIQPQYIILKPSLIGGFSRAEEWISLAEQMKIKWWATSALESNIGLNAIAQWTFEKNNPMPQGLGTGGLFTNNFDCPLQVGQGQLFYRKGLSWPIQKIKELCI